MERCWVLQIHRALLATRPSKYLRAPPKNQIQKIPFSLAGHFFLSPRPVCYFSHIQSIYRVAAAAAAEAL